MAANGTVELLIKESKTVQDAPITKETIGNYGRCNPFRVVFIFFIICSVDIIAFYFMNDIYNSAVNKLDTSTTSCINELQYLSNPLYVIIPALSFISTIILITSAGIFYSQIKNKMRWTIIYFGAIIIHSILFWYENALMSDIISHTNNTSLKCININTNIMILKYTWMIKALLFNAIFIATFLYYLGLQFIALRLTIVSANINKRKCILMSIFIICCIIFLSIILVMIDMYYYNGIHIHAIGSIFGLLQIKCHLCTSNNHSNHINSNNITSSYVANAKSNCGSACPGGCGMNNGCTGCCECDCNRGGCCVFCYNSCGSTPIPDTLCCSCCGYCTTFCNDAGGWLGYCCCSIDYCTWCGC